MGGSKTVFGEGFYGYVFPSPEFSPPPLFFSELIRHRFPDLTLFRWHIDPCGGEGEADSRVGSGGPVLNNWRVPNPPGANPLVAERAPWRSSQSCVTGGEQPIGNPYRFLSFLLHTWKPLCDTNGHSWGRLFQLPGG